MGSANCTIKSVEGQLRVELFGKLTAATVKEIGAQLSEGIKKASAIVLITAGVTDCAEDARAELVKVQQSIAAQQLRSAWVDDRSQFRGIALWVMHLANDQAAKATATLEQANRWLASKESREASAASRAVGT